MPTYHLTLTALIEVEAPNVAKAHEVARENVRVIGQRVGGRHSQHDPKGWRHRLTVIGMGISLPVRTDR